MCRIHSWHFQICGIDEYWWEWKSVLAITRQFMREHSRMLKNVWSILWELAYVRFRLYTNGCSNELCKYVHGNAKQTRFYNIPEWTHEVNFYILQLQHDFRLVNIPKRYRKVKSGNCEKKLESNLTIYCSSFPYSFLSIRTTHPLGALVLAIVNEVSCALLYH